MRILVNYFRRLFCKHDFSLIANIRSVDEYGDTIGRRKVYFCKKCGYCRRIKL